MDDPLQKLRLLIGSERMVIGSERTLKYLKNGKVEEIYLASNAPEEVVADIEYYAKLANVPVYKLEIDNEELGGFIRKPFKVAVISILKNG